MFCVKVFSAPKKDKIVINYVEFHVDLICIMAYIKKRELSIWNLWFVTTRREATRMRNDVGILIAEDDDGHFSLIQRNLSRVGITNEVTRFSDGQGILDFLTHLKDSNNPKSKQPWLLILDIRMPKVDGYEVLKIMKSDPLLKVIPVIVVTTAGNEKVIEECHEAGCNVFVVKPVEYSEFVEAITQIGRFLSIVEVPILSS